MPVQIVLVDAFNEVVDDLTFDSIDAANVAFDQLSCGPNAGLHFFEWDETEIGQCECCDRLYLRSEEMKDEATGDSGFCSDDCVLQAIDEVRMYRYEAYREYAMCGDDYDSWYR